MNDIYNLVSQNIKKYRKIKNLTQKELAAISGYSYSYIRRIESENCIKNFSLQTINNISKALKIDIQLIFVSSDI